jgi:hypothetical protein
MDAFVELNLFVYHSLQGKLLDAVIWCLGPYVDDRRRYSLARLWLAWLTRRLVRRVLGLGTSPEARE